jgi:uncharacterized protein
MSPQQHFEIKRYDFDSKLFSEFDTIHYAKDLWPVVYILSDGALREAYVGETTSTYERMSVHLKNNSKSKLTAIHLITSESFNKSATLDIESNLIKYISGDGQYKLLNGNVGLANHNYYQKAEYWKTFTLVWEKLRSQGVSKHSIDFINNSDLFKYSPYKSLSSEQRNSLIVILNNLCQNDFSTTLVEGGAGTGKTILAIFLFKLLNSNIEDFNFKEFEDSEDKFQNIVKELRVKYQRPKMALVVPMASFRKTLKKVFKNINGLNANMVVGPSDLAQENYDIVVVDESHRLRRRVNLGTYFGVFDKVCQKLNMDKYVCSELDWVIKQSGKAILFYDQNQSIKPSDTKNEDFARLKTLPSTKIEILRSQFRVKGGRDYVDYLDKLLTCSFERDNKKFSSSEYEFLLFDSIDDLVSEIKKRDKENGLSRLIAGYSWEWISKEDKQKKDIKIGGTELMWNSVNEDWINSDNSINEVGCIHTTQGYDLNYAGIIFGREITYDRSKNEISIIKENYFDKNGKQSIKEPSELKAFIVNIYKTIMLRGIKGTYVYVCDKELRNYFAQHIRSFASSAISPSFILKESIRPFENAVPVYDLRAAAGNFSHEQIVNENRDEFEWVPLPPGLKPSKDLFACKIVGESMNKIIPNGSICLFRKYTGGSRNGRIVLVQHTAIQDPDMGSGYTVKEYHSKKQDDGTTWHHESITLRPLSNNNDYKDIELSDSELVDLKVIGIFERVL